MIKLIFSFPVQVFQNISRALSKLLKASKNPVLTRVLSFRALIGATITAFLVYELYTIVEPFGIQAYSSANKKTLIGLSALAGFVGMLISDFGLPLIFRKYFNREEWTISKDISLFVLRFFFIGLMVMVFGNQTGLTNFNLPLFLLQFTSVGFGLAVFASFIKESFLRKKYTANAIALNERIKNLEETVPKSNTFPIIKFKGSNDVISIVPNQLISAKVGTYHTDFVYLNIFGTVKKTLDIGYKEVVKELNKYGQFKKLAKKYFVNNQALYKIEGNGAGYQVHIIKITEPLKVRNNKVLENI